MSDSPIVIVNRNEFDFLKDDEHITQMDIVEMIEHKDCFEKFIRKAIRKIRIDLANVKYIDREKEAYHEMNALNELSRSLGETVKNYKEYTAKLEE